MNNTITEMESTLYSINTRITEAGKWMSELKTEQRKKNERNEDSLRDLGTILNVHQHSHYMGLRRRIGRGRT